MNRYEIAVISMPGSPRRKQVAENLRELQDVRWSFFDGLTAEVEVPGISNIPERQIGRFGRVLGNAEIGCFKSHVSLLTNFLHLRTHPWLLVMEDDVWLDDRFDIGEVMDFAEAQGLHYVRLFAKAYKPARVIGSLSGFRQVIRFKTDPYGTQAYLISKQGANAFLKNLKFIERPIDDEFGRFWHHGLLPVSVFPFPAAERALGSTIEKDRDGGGPRIRYRGDLLAFRAVEKLRKSMTNLRETIPWIGVTGTRLPINAILSRLTAGAGS